MTEKTNTPKLIVMCGLQGSGKTTFSQHMTKCCHDTMIRISQDESNKKTCHTEIAKHKSTNKILIVDCCNGTCKARAEWLQYFKTSQLPIWCIYLKSDPNECIKRIRQRKEHPTLNSNSRTIPMIVRTMNKRFEEPTTDEGFEHVITLSSFDQTNELFRQWKMPEITTSL